MTPQINLGRTDREVRGHLQTFSRGNRERSCSAGSAAPPRPLVLSSSRPVILSSVRLHYCGFLPATLGSASELPQKAFHIFPSTSTRSTLDEFKSFGYLVVCELLEDREPSLIHLRVGGGSSKYGVRKVQTSTVQQRSVMTKMCCLL